MSWEKKALAKVADFDLGKMLDQKKNKGDSLPYLANKNVRWGSFDFTEIREMPFEQKELGRFSLKSGDIVMCEGGEPGRCAIWQEQMPNMMYQKALHRIRPKQGMDSIFLYYNLSHRARTGHFNGLFTGSTIKHLPKEKLSLVEVDVPDPLSQKRIASILSAYDDLIENNRRRIALLEDAARQLYKEWFVRFRFPGHEHSKIIDGIPEGWKRTTAADVMDILSGGTPKTTIDEFWGGDIPFYTPKDSSESIYVMETEKTLTERGLSSCASKLYPKNTLFITARGTVGKLNLAQTHMAMNQSCYALVGNGAVTQKFLYFSLNAGINQLKSRAVGAVFDAIIKDTFNTIPYLLPTTALIRYFSEIVEPNLQQVDVLLNQNHLLTQARDLLLPKLMNGEITV